MTSTFIVFHNHRKGEVCKALGKELSAYLDDDLGSFWTIVHIKVKRLNGTTVAPREKVEAMTTIMGETLEQLEREAGSARVAALKFYMYRMQREKLDADADELLFQALLCERANGTMEERIDYVSKLFELRCGPERARRLLEHVARKVDGGRSLKVPEGG